MNKNSFLNFSNLLPITISKEGDAIHYKLPNDLSESEVIDFLESEMPGIIIGDYSETEFQTHTSIFCKDEKYFLFEGYNKEDYIEDHYTIEVVIYPIKTINQTHDLYIYLLEKFSNIDDGIFDKFNTPTPYDLFWNFFKERGYEKTGQREEHNNDGYGVTTFEFTKAGEVYSVIYPEYDYNPNSNYYSDGNVTVDGYYFNWTAFISAIKEDNIEAYDGYRKE